MDLHIISEHRHILSSSDSIETFKPGCRQFLSRGSGVQGDKVVKRKHWRHMEIKFPSFEIQHSNSHLLKLGSSAHSEIGSYHLPSYWSCGFRVELRLQSLSGGCCWKRRFWFPSEPSHQVCSPIAFFAQHVVLLSQLEDSAQAALTIRDCLKMGSPIS